MHSFDVESYFDKTLFLFCFCFSFQHFKDAVPLSSGVHSFRWENYGYSYLHSSITCYCLPFDCFLRFFFLSLVFTNLVMMCHNVVFLCSSYLKFFELLRSVGLQPFSNLEHGSHYLLKYFFYLPHPSRTPVTYMLDCLKFFPNSWDSVHVSFCFFLYLFHFG